MDVKWCSFCGLTQTVTRDGVSEIKGKPAVAHIDAYKFGELLGLCQKCLDTAVSTLTQNGNHPLTR